MNKRSITLIVMAALLLTISLSFVLRDTHEPLPQGAAELYQKHCASCHGEQLDRFAARQWVYGNTVAEVSSTIKHGRPAIGMPAFANAMNDQEIEALSRFTIERVAQVPATITSTFVSTDTIRSLDLTFVLEEVVGENLNIPWGLAQLPNGDLLVTDKRGQLYQVRNRVMTLIEGVPPVVMRGQGGLMDVILHPNFEKNKLIYISYADGESSNAINTTIARAELKDGKLVRLEKIFHATPDSNSGVHFGCRMFFDKDGYLFFSIGERGRMQNAQDLTNHSGKIHRLHADGSIPKDNPFVKTPGAMGSIWSYGHRNPQGLIYDERTGTIWENEHGPKGGDELNIIRKGLNYGWPVVSFGINYDGTILTPDTTKAGLERPVHYWIPSIGPSSLAKVSSPRYPGWEGDFLSGSLSFEYLERTIMRNNRVIGSEKLLPKIGRVRHVLQAPDGFIYITVERSGKVYRLAPVK